MRTQWHGRQRGRGVHSSQLRQAGAAHHTSATGSVGASEVSELRRELSVMKQEIAELRMLLASAGHLNFSAAVHGLGEDPEPH
eukprot:2313087-Pyramimonas_sp.AAC.1